MGVPAESDITAVSSLTVPGTLPTNLCIFIRHPDGDGGAADLAGLEVWGGASEVCRAVGKTIGFPTIDSDIFNFLAQMRQIYPPEISLDVARTCLCKLKTYRSGLLVIRIPASKSSFVRKVADRLPQGTAIAVISVVGDLFAQ
jgi:hypothetical protein